MKKETVEEFLARGGSIQYVPAPDEVETVNVLKPITQYPEKYQFTLGDGEFYFTESKPKKEKKKVLLKDIVDNYNLPEALVNKLKGLSNE